MRLSQNITFNKTEFEKMKTNLINLEKANKLTIRFSINYFIQSCIDNGLDNVTYCNYLYQAHGHQTIISLLPKFLQEEGILSQLLSILDSCLKNLKSEEVASSFSNSNLLPILIEIIQNSQFHECQRLCFEIIIKLAYFSQTHTALREKGLFGLLNLELSNANKNIEGKNVAELLRLGQVFETIKFLGQVERTLDCLVQDKVIHNLFSCFQHNQGSLFVKKHFVNLLLPISRNQNSVKILNETNIDLKQLLIDILKEQNFDLIKKMQEIVINVMDEAGMVKLIEECKQSQSPNALVLLGYVSSHDVYFYLFEDQ